MLKDDVLFAPLREQGQLLRTRKIGSVELTESYLERLETQGPKLGALVTLTRDLALAQARRADAGAWPDASARPCTASRTAPRTCWPRTARPPPGAPSRSRAGLRLRRDRDREAARRGRGAAGQARHGRAGGRPRLQQPRRQLHRPRPLALEPATTGAAARPADRAAATARRPRAPSPSAPRPRAPSSRPARTAASPACGPTYGLVSRHGAMALCWTLDKLGPMAAPPTTAGSCSRRSPAPIPRTRPRPAGSPIASAARRTAGPSAASGSACCRTRPRARSRR